jgi:hypothetical protein
MYCQQPFCGGKNEKETDQTGRNQEGNVIGRLAHTAAPVLNWAGVGDWIHQHICWTHQHSGSCHHKSCKAAVLLEQAAYDLDLGGESEYSPADFAKFVRQKQCHGFHSCNHRGCINAEMVKDWLAAQEKKKAA